MAKPTRASVMGEYEAVIRTAMARTLFVTAYADYVEEHDGRPDLPRARGGQNWEDVAPHTSFMAMEAVDDLVKRFAAIEPGGPYQMAELFSHAMEAEDGQPWSWPKKASGVAIELMQEFGSDMVMQSLGHGVSWFDDHKEFELEFPDFECGLELDSLEMWWSGMAAGPREYGFDLTKFKPGGFQKVLKALGVVVAGGSMHDVSGVSTWYWCGPGIEITCQNDPITGEYANGRRKNEKDFASYMGLRGTPSVVMRAVALIRHHAASIKDESTERLAYISFSPEDAPGPEPVIEMVTNPSSDSDLEDEGPTEDDYVTTDYVDWYQYRKHVLTVPDDDNWRIAVELHMAKEKFWPNVWFISDHGNAQLLSLAYDNPGSTEPLPKGTKVNVTAPDDDSDVVGTGIVKYFKGGEYGIQLDGERRVDLYAPAQVFPADGRANPGKASTEWVTVAVVSADRSKDADATSSELAVEIERTFGVTTMREATYPLWRVLTKGTPKIIAKIRSYAQSWLANEGIASTRPNPQARR